MVAKHGVAHVGAHGPSHHTHLVGLAHHAACMPEGHPGVSVHAHGRHRRVPRHLHARPWGGARAACTDCIANTVPLFATRGVRSLPLLVLLLFILFLLFLLLLFLLVRIAVDDLLRPFLVDGIGEIPLYEGRNELLVLAPRVEFPDSAGGAVLLEGAVPILVVPYALADELPHQLLVIKIHGATHYLLGNVQGLRRRLHPLCHEGLLISLGFGTKHADRCTPESKWRR
mmetsp:Transcript_62925/g.135113  ORF Transcript_62925/g.135113 Transcript_62925/m.135113 type:complete len:228 (+) Transcript_62925:74-757(+)